MAAEGREVSVITVGGKGAYLSSAIVSAVANGLSQSRIDSSVLDRLSNPKNPSPPPSSQFKFSLLKDLSPEESRAALLILLNKLLLSGGIRPTLPLLISDALNNNNNNKTLDLDLDLDRAFDLTDDELFVLDKSLFILDGICAILDHQSSTLSAIADAVAALSCEASGADVSAFNNLTDSGDASSANKDEIAVASDLKVLLIGSKLVGKLHSDSVSEIPQVHATFREISRLVHSRMRSELNSPVVKTTGGTGKALATVFSSLSEALRHLGMSSWSRAKLNIDVMSNVDLRSGLNEVFGRECPSVDSLGDLLMSSSQAGFRGQYIKFFHELNRLSEIVSKIFAWEATTAFISLEGNELTEKLQGNAMNGVSAKTEKKREKKKKVLGKGTSVLMQFIKDRLQSGVGEAVDHLVLLEKWTRDLLSFFDPKHSGFPSLLMKVKELVESNESRRLPKLPKGTRDFAKEQMAIREKAFSIIAQVFKRHGAMALDTPAFELRETLMGKYGEDSKLIYDLADQGGELCSLRYDLTVPFARYVAMNGITSFKRYQIAKVYRRDNPSKGRYREFYQCDFDIAGQYEAMGPDFEVIKVMTELLDELNIGDYEVKLNHRKLLDGMLDICGVPPEKFRTICSSIDKLDKQSFEQVKKEMVEEKGLTVETADQIGTFVKERGHPLELLSKLRLEGSKFLENQGSLLALNELEILFKALEKSKCIDKVVFDLSLARGLDYYTGVIFEAVFKGSTQVGSIAAGGRYDNLIGMFGTKQVPAVGVSLGIERVFTIMEQLQKDQNQATRATETQVLVCILGDDLSVAAELVSELWSARLKAEYIVSKRMLKFIERAKASRIPWMVIVGERELNEGVVKLKDVEAAKEEEIRRDVLVEVLQRRLSGNKDLCGKPLDLECKSPAVPSDPQKSSPVKIILIVICCLVALAAIIMVLIIYRRSSMTPQLGSSSSLKATGLPVPAAVVVAEQQQYGSSPDMSVSGNSKRGDQHGKLSFVRDDRQRFDLQDLLRASAEVLGSGNFGSSYKAVLMDGHAVVVKRFKHMNNCGREEFHEHMRRLGRLGHPNLLPLVAYYYRKEEKLLVFDYVHHGSLASHLHGNHSAEQPGLDWATRLKIVKGVARGLFYLHEELPSLIVPHGHLKSSNVLLDESMEPLLMDYTLVPVVNLERAQQIMVAYKSPEYAQQGRTTRKTDVWSLGILILEILTGKFPANYLIAQSGTDAAELTSWVDSIAKEDTARVFDKEMGTKNNNNNNNINGHDQEGEMLKLLKIGVACCEEDAAKRWDLKEVLQKIEELN